MNKKIKILILILFALIIAAGSWWAWQEYLLKTADVSVITDKTDYRKEESLKVNIKNNSQRSICFSSCYPYLLEKKNAEWESYLYDICEKPNVNEVCIEPDQTKAFAIDLSLMEEGTHRIVLPICFSCKVGREFKESRKFYSNDFVIK